MVDDEPQQRAKPDCQHNRSGTLATHTTVLRNGSYTILLSATDTADKTQNSNVLIFVGGNYKPGRLTTIVTDLVVPAPGLATQIQRTYDSLLRNSSGDFGFGCSLAINVQLEISPTSDITFTLSGQRRTFYFTPIPQGILSFLYQPFYTPDRTSLECCAVGCNLYSPRPWSIPVLRG